jgi:uncharacterized protein (TIGR02246 family)
LQFLRLSKAPNQKEEKIMKYTKSLFCGSVLLSILFFVFNCGPAQLDNATLLEAIAAQNGKFMEAVSNADAAALADLYTEDGQILPPNSDIVTGKAAIQQAMQGMMDMGIKKVTLDVIEVEGIGDMAYEVGKYVMFVEGDQMMDQGNYIVVWKNVEGVWKLHRDIWNSNMAAPEQQ